MHAISRTSFLVLSFVTASWSWLACGCAGDPGRPGGEHARRARPFPPLAAKETFFGGVIAAEVLVGALTGFDRGDAAGGAGGGGEGRRHRGGGGGFHRGGGGPGGGGRHGGEGGGDEGPGERGEAADGGSSPLRRADLMGSAPVMIHVRFTNTGAEPVELVIADFLSPLGNFVVHPDKLALGAGASAEIEPMTSRLAGEVTSAEITLTLRRGAQTETKTIQLAAPPDAAPAPAPAARESTP